ncbi:MAG: selenocysteine-specific translation elongation factor [Chthoniobacteraceae bacterium]
MSAQHFIVATAGHVDHGKSALVIALTGVDPDRLPEEKARGITIELGFAHLRLGEFEIGIIDVPGHEDFVKNMVAGVGAVDAALFIVAADDSWMPQTEEHLQILGYQGVRHAVVALTKIDLCADESASVAAVREKLRGTPFADAPIVPTSIVAGRGIDELKSALSSVLASTPPPRDSGKPRLAVDRAFTLRGIGTVVTGTLSGGEFRRGQSVVIQPAGMNARVRGIQSHSREVESVGPGTRTALSLPDVALAAAGQPGVARGDVIALENMGVSGMCIDAVISRSARCESGKGRPALKHGARVRIHHGSGNVAARVLLYRAPIVAPGESIVARLRLERPWFACTGDRFIVRDWSETATLAGGIVLESGVPARFHAPAHQRLLAQRAAAPADIEVFVGTQVERDGIVRGSALLTDSVFSDREIAAAAARLVECGRARQVGEFIVHADWWKALAKRAADAVDAAHAAHPDLAGLPLTELRALCKGELGAPGLFDTFVRDLCGDGFAQSGTALARASHRPSLPPHLEAAGARIRAAFAAKPFDPPPRRELAADSLSQQALRFLREKGEVIEFADDLFLTSTAYARIRETIARFIQANGPATVSELRQALATTRRVMLPVLDRLDREGFTVRAGDRRSLRAAKPAADSRPPIS